MKAYATLDGSCPFQLVNDASLNYLYIRVLSLSIGKFDFKSLFFDLARES
jgi:hypothetical protein